MGERRRVVVGKEGGTTKRGKGQRVHTCRRSDKREGREYPYKPMSNTKNGPHPEQTEAPQGRDPETSGVQKQRASSSHLPWAVMLELVS